MSIYPVNELPPSPRTNQGTLHRIAEERVQRVREIFEQCFPDVSDGWAIVTAGSDGRREELGGTPFEVCLLCRERRPSTVARDPFLEATGRLSAIERSNNGMGEIDLETSLNGSMVIPYSPERRRSYHTSAVDTEFTEISRELSSTPSEYERQHASRAAQTSGTSGHKDPRTLEVEDKIQQVLRENSDLFFEKLVRPDMAQPLRLDIKRSGGVISPGRPLESEWVFGDQELVEEYKAVSRRAVASVGASERRSFQKDVLNPAIRELETCVDGSLVPVCLSTGVLTYNGMGLASVKYPLLRPIQYFLIWHLMHIKGLPSVVRGEKSAEALLQEMPRPVMERVLWMHGQGFFPNMPPEKAKALCDMYSALLFWYGKSQEALSQGVAEIRVDHERLGSIAESILLFIHENPPFELKQKKPGRKTPTTPVKTS